MSDRTSSLDRVLEPITDCLTPGVVAKLVALRDDSETQAVSTSLRTRRNEGARSTEERAEYDQYREAFYFFTILQPNARQLPTEQPTP